MDAHGNALTLMLMAFLILNPAWASSVRRAGLVWRRWPRRPTRRVVKLQGADQVIIGAG